MCQDVERVFLTKLSMMPPCEEELGSAGSAAKKKTNTASPAPAPKAANINRGSQKCFWLQTYRLIKYSIRSSILHHSDRCENVSVYQCCLKEGPNSFF